MEIVFLDEDTVSLNGDVDLSRVHALGEYKGFMLSPTDDPLPHCRGFRHAGDGKRYCRFE